MKKNEKVLFGISFDAVSMSGIIVEFSKTADIFHKNGYKIFLDLGYEIKADKENFFKPYSDRDRSCIPDWIELSRIKGLQAIEGYDQAFVCDFFNETFSSDSRAPLPNEKIIEAIASCILNTWRELNVSFVVVENGTLPENIHYTLALYKAIEQYGNEKNLSRYVFWRDHDPMWSSEPLLKKYGEFPYIETPKPKVSEFIQHIVLHEADYNQMKKWAPEAQLSILPNSFTLETKQTRTFHDAFRRDYNIPYDAVLIARYTRIIFPKRIDRDIHLLAALIKLFQAHHIAKKVYLFIAGKKDENSAEFSRLVRLSKELNVEEYIIFEDGLLPYDDSLLFPQSKKYSIKDLLLSSNLACFLTSYDYESYGNPIGEAIACQTPFVATSYSRYHEVYGKRGVEGVILAIDEANDFITGSEAFYQEVFDFLLDNEKQDAVVKKNTEIANQYFSISNLEEQIKKLYPLSLEMGIYRGVFCDDN